MRLQESAGGFPPGQSTYQARGLRSTREESRKGTARTEYPGKNMLLYPSAVLIVPLGLVMG